ncbi:MAG: hypothetical protein ABIQ59_09645 [Nocardioidaceae bacterium]
MTPAALLLTGTVGIGKTTVAEAVGDMLRDVAVPNAVVDVDWLRAAWPAPPGDPFNGALALRNLAAVTANYLDAGVVRLVLAGVLETAEDRAAYAAVLGMPLVVVRLVADASTVQRRLLRRHAEDDAARSWHLHRAGELHAIQEASGVEHFVVDTTSRSVVEVAGEVLRVSGWTS